MRFQNKSRPERLLWLLLHISAIMPLAKLCKIKKAALRFDAAIPHNPMCDGK
jgi:hypothetical protein